MEITETLYVKNRQEWRSWLSVNFQVKKEIWLIYYKKNSGKNRIPYDDAVEEALCFGWIDSTVKKVDEEMFVQRFTPRNKRSIWSELNKQRVEELLKSGRMTEYGMSLVIAAKENGEWDREPYTKTDMPDFFEKLLFQNEKARHFYYSLTKKQQESYLRYVNLAKQDETRLRRTVKVIELLNMNKKPGMM